jgi:hypothetical protein
MTKTHLISGAFFSAVGKCRTVDVTHAIISTFFGIKNTQGFCNKVCFADLQHWFTSALDLYSWP